MKIVKNFSNRTIKALIIQANIDDFLFKRIRCYNLYFYILGFDGVCRSKYNYVF